MAEPIRFPDVPVYQGWGAPVRLESELRDLEVVAGRVPEDLNGTLYRCGPDPQYPPMQAGPVALIRLPTRVRSTFHGMWVPTAAMATGIYPVIAMRDAARAKQRAAVE
jgi:carotenoid cleavage dioxygenase-like enzyme